jgi:decaprenyl-phosphate phosphoribosyltransferase
LSDCLNRLGELRQPGVKYFNFHLKIFILGLKSSFRALNEIGLEIMVSPQSPPKQDPLKRGISSTKFFYLAALRPRQWTKNLVVFAAPLFAFNLTWQSILGCLLAFVLFCCASSGFYLINDIADVESDRQHPSKCKRPIAAGLVSIPAAITMSVVLLGIALSVSWLRSPALGITLTGYMCLQIAYNWKLKRTPILDIVAIATGFVLRAYAGFAATGIYLSAWFLLCTAMLALFLAIEKRKAELRLSEIKGGKTRAVLKRYSLPLLIRMESTVTTGAFMSYTLWSAGPIIHGATTPWMMLTTPFVLYGIFRYQMLSDPKDIITDTENNLGEGQYTERPEEVLLTDRPILLTVVSWIATVFMVLFLKHNGIIQ